MPEELADVVQRGARFEQARAELAAQIMEVQVDGAVSVLRSIGQTVPALPLRAVAVGAQDRGLPGLADAGHSLPDFIAEDIGADRERPPIDGQATPREDARQLASHWDESGFIGLGLSARELDQSRGAIRCTVHLRPLQRQELADAAAGRECGDDQVA